MDSGSKFLSVIPVFSVRGVLGIDHLLATDPERKAGQGGVRGSARKLLDASCVQGTLTAGYLCRLCHHPRFLIGIRLRWRAMIQASMAAAFVVEVHRRLREDDG